jgi:DNA polymerase III subunit delta'
VPLLPLHGHAVLLARFNDAIRRDVLPGSLLLHGPAGVGKQRLALWLGQRLVCDGPEPRPCGECQHCRYALRGAHPDVHWYFPRPRLKDSDASPEKIEDDLREAIGDRVKTGAYPPSAPGVGLNIATIRALVHSAAMAPALAARKIYILGDAERMVLNEGAEDAAGAFLKLLEEPPPRATLILTSSEPGALVPTIRSRLVAVRVPALGAAEASAVLAEPAMRDAIASAGGPASADEQLRVAAGAPGVLLGGAEWGEALVRARRILDAATGQDRREQMKTALMQGSSKARGAFSSALDALTTLLHERVRAATDRGNEAGAAAAARALDEVELAKERAAGNVNPQLVTIELVRQLGGLLA